MSQPSPFARLVAERRRAHGMSVRRLAELVGRSPGTVRGWERGKTVPREAAVIEALAAVLGLDEGELTTAIDATLGATAIPATASPPGSPPVAVRADAGQGQGTAGSMVTASGSVASAGTVLGPESVPVVPSYLEDPAERNAYRLRYALTAALLLLLFVVLVWSTRHLFATLGDLWRAILDAYAG